MLVPIPNLDLARSCTTSLLATSAPLATFLQPSPASRAAFVHSSSPSLASFLQSSSASLAAFVQSSSSDCSAATSSFGCRLSAILHWLEAAAWILAVVLVLVLGFAVHLYVKLRGSSRDRRQHPRT
ncbi:MAG TPA: hypothetical protein VM865_08475 [Acidobacteriaceae bacterium]|nr:hypothetical protein [Acidobacteriaceae bacterium]